MVDKDGMHVDGTDGDGWRRPAPRAALYAASTPRDLLTTTIHLAAIARTPSTPPVVEIAPGAQVPSRRGLGCNELVTLGLPGAAPTAPLSFNECTEEQGDNNTQAAQLGAKIAGLASIKRDKTNEAVSATVANTKAPASLDRAPPENQTKTAKSAASAAAKTPLPAPSRAAPPERPRQSKKTISPVAAAATPTAPAPSDRAPPEHQTKITDSAASAAAKTPLPAAAKTPLPAAAKTPLPAAAKTPLPAAAKTPLPAPSRAAPPERPRPSKTMISPATVAAKPTAPAPSDRVSPVHQTKTTESAVFAAAKTPLPAPSRTAPPGRPRPSETMISPATAAAKLTAPALSNRASPEQQTKTDESDAPAAAKTPLPAPSCAAPPGRPRPSEKPISSAAAAARPTAPAPSDRALPEKQRKTTESAAAATGKTVLPTASRGATGVAALAAAAVAALSGGAGGTPPMSSSASSDDDVGILASAPGQDGRGCMLVAVPKTREAAVRRSGYDNKAGTAQPIFNSQPVEEMETLPKRKQDRRRRQVSITGNRVFAKEMRQRMSVAAECAREALGRAYTFASPHFLIAVPRALPQLTHADMGQHVDDGGSGALLALYIAFESGTYVDVWSYTFGRAPEGTAAVALPPPERVHIPVGFCLLLRSDLVHRGTSSLLSCQKRCVHAYLSVRTATRHRVYATHTTFLLENI